MSLAYAILLVIFLVVAVLLVVFILAQQGKGAGMGASFGAGASNTLFGSVGSGNFFTKATWVLALLLMVVCLMLGYINSHKGEQANTYQSLEVEEPAKENVKSDKVEAPVASEKEEVKTENKASTDSSKENAAQDTKQVNDSSAKEE